MVCFIKISDTLLVGEVIVEGDTFEVLLEKNGDNEWTLTVDGESYTAAGGCDNIDLTFENVTINGITSDFTVNEDYCCNISSSSGNSSGSTSCTGCVPPDTLYATFELVTGTCACMPIVVTLVWNGTDSWVGNLDVCATNINIGLGCVSGNWLMQKTCGGGGPEGVALSGNCSPLYLEGTTLLTMSGCCTGVTATVTITE